MTQMTLSIPATAAAISGMAERVAQFGTTSGLDSQACFQVQVIVTEALNNIVCHGLEESTTTSIKIRCRTLPSALEITIYDSGRPLESVPGTAFPNAQAEHGRGWPIIMAWADHVQYRALTSHNELTLSKRTC